MKEKEQISASCIIADHCISAEVKEKEQINISAALKEKEQISAGCIIADHSISAEGEGADQCTAVLVHCGSYGAKVDIRSNMYVVFWGVFESKTSLNGLEVAICIVRYYYCLNTMIQWSIKTISD